MKVATGDSRPSRRRLRMRSSLAAGASAWTSEAVRKDRTGRSLLGTLRRAFEFRPRHPRAGPSREHKGLRPRPPNPPGDGPASGLVRDSRWWQPAEAAVRIYTAPRCISARCAAGGAGGFEASMTPEEFSDVAAEGRSADIDVALSRFSASARIRNPLAIGLRAMRSAIEGRRPGRDRAAQARRRLCPAARARVPA